MDELWRTWVAMLRQMPDDGWSRPTRLPGWDVAALVAHHSMFPRGVQAMVERRVDGPATVASAAAMLRFFNRPDGAATRLAPAVADQARNIATEAPPEELLRRFTDDGPRAIGTVRAAGPIVVDYFGHGALPLAEALSIAVLEATTHLLDLQRALDVPPSVPEAGLAATVALLAQVADPVAFVEAATGRTDANPLPVIR